METTIVKIPICNHDTKCFNEDKDHRKNFLHSSPKPCKNPNCSNPKCIFQHSEKSNDSALRKRIDELENKSNDSDLQKRVEEIEKKYADLTAKYDRLINIMLQSKVSQSMPLPTFQPMMQQPYQPFQVPFKPNN